MITLERIVNAVGGHLDGPPGLPLRGMASLEEAGPEDLVFVKDERHLARLRASKGGAVICRKGDDVRGRPAIRVGNPRLAAALAVALFRPTVPIRPGIHALAFIAPDAKVPASCSVAPFAVVESGAVLGERVHLGPHVVVGAGSRVGDDTRLMARVVLYPGVTVGARCEIHAGVVIGSPGFGYEQGPDGPVGFPQHGTVVIGDEVRIGANSTVDRATFGATRLGKGVKIDNLVQVSHNVTVGDGVLICALSGIGGGARLEDRSVVGPQGALAPEALLGKETILGARGAIASHQRLEAPGRVFMGDTPMPIEDWKRWQVFRIRWGRRRRGLRGADDRM